MKSVSDFPEQDLSQQVPVAMRLVFSARAHQRNRAPFAESLQEAQSKFLSVVLDGFAFLVSRSGIEKFLAVTTAELPPS
jgi:hypothetical protein